MELWFAAVIVMGVLTQLVGSLRLRPTTSSSIPLLVRALRSDLSDILNNADLEEVEARFEQLRGIFPTVEADELEEIVRLSPVLLFLETSKIKEAIKKLNTAVAFVDPSYLLTQRAPGVELLMSVSTPSFDIQRALQDVVSVVGVNYNSTGLIRRVPQILTPKYLLALKEVLSTLEGKLACTSLEGLALVERFPGIVNVASSLPGKIDRLEASLLKNGVLIEGTGGSDSTLKSIVLAVPRVLMQDTDKRLHSLSVQYPSWSLGKVVKYNPHVLTQKLDLLAAHYSDLAHELSDLCDVDTVINNMPTALRFSTSGLRAKAAKMSSLFPSAYGGRFVLERCPELVFSFGLGKLKSQIKKVERSFLAADSAASSSLAGIDEETDDGDEKDGEEDGLPQLDISRILVTNSNLFLRRFPYFCSLIKQWVKEYEDSAVAYTVLNSVPSVLTKSPSALRPTVKALYATVAEARAAAADCDKGGVGDGFNAPATAISQGAICLALQKLLMGAPQVIRQSPAQIKERLAALKDLFASPETDAQKGSNSKVTIGPLLLSNSRVLTEPMERLSLRLVVLGRMQRLVLEPFLSEEELEREKKRGEVDRFALKMPHSLSAPLACLLRPFFVKSCPPELDLYRRANTVEEAYTLTSQLIDCNTEEFLSLTGGQSADQYASFLLNVSEDLDDGTGGIASDRSSSSPSASEIERRVCGLLNDLAASAVAANPTTTPAKLRKILEERVLSTFQESSLRV